jgi:hypothetical protein
LALVHSAELGCGWKRWRMAALREKPPTFISTPSFARTRTTRPSRCTATPAMRSPSLMNSTSAHSVQIGNCSRIAICSMRPWIAAPAPARRLPVSLPLSMRPISARAFFLPPQVRLASIRSGNSLVGTGRLKPL